jgi:hypothetical protein
MTPKESVMSSRNGNKWRAAITHRDVVDLVEQIRSEHKLLVNFGVQYAPSVVIVYAAAVKVGDPDTEMVSYVAKYSASPLHAQPLETILYRVAWDLFQQAEAGVRGFKGSDSLW